MGTIRVTRPRRGGPRLAADTFVGWLVVELDVGDPEQPVWERIMDAGRSHDIRPIAPCEPRRVEAGIFNYGSDMTISDSPLEVTGMERLVEDQEAEYLGKEALDRQKHRGVSRKLVGVEMDGAPLGSEFPEHRPAYHHDREIGPVTVMVWSPRLERYIGYVWVPIDLAEPGTGIEVDAPGRGRVPARTAALPFIDPHKRIPAA